MKLSALLLSTVLSLTSSKPLPRAPIVKIMALGDSITGSPGCWRALLWQKLQTANIINTDFVGTQYPQGCGFSYDGENEGHGGAYATMMADQKQLVGWLSQTKPDVVMMHLGTNDIWSQTRNTSVILGAYSTLVDQMRASKSSMYILVAKIIPMNPNNCATCAQRVTELNNAIPAWAASKNSAASPIMVVDCWTGFDTAKDTSDGVHPTDSGNVKLANSWYPSLAAIVKSFA